MKKRFLSVISAVVALVICVCASGCNLVTKNSEREMNTVVATVNVNTKEDIYKKDMIMAINDAMYHIGGITVIDPDDPVLMAYRALACTMEKKNALKAVLGSAMEEAIGWLGSVLDD